LTRGKKEKRKKGEEKKEKSSRRFFHSSEGNGKEISPAPCRPVAWRGGEKGGGGRPFESTQKKWEGLGSGITPQGGEGKKEGWKEKKTRSP